MRDSAPLWLAVGGVAAALSAAPLTVGATEKPPGASVWDNGWIVTGLGMAVLGLLALLWALVLVVAHRHGESLDRHPVSRSRPPSRAPRSKVPAKAPSAPAPKSAPRHLRATTSK